MTYQVRSESRGQCVGRAVVHGADLALEAGDKGALEIVGWMHRLAS